MTNKTNVNYQHEEEEYKRNDGRWDECNADIYEP